MNFHNSQLAKLISSLDTGSDDNTTCGAAVPGGREP